MEIVDVFEVCPSISGNINCYSFLRIDDAVAFLKDRGAIEGDYSIDKIRIGVSLETLSELVKAVPVNTTYATHYMESTSVSGVQLRKY